MTSLTKVNPQIVDSLNVQAQTITDQAVTERQGRGLAFQAVAQSTAMAVQDATDYLRNMSMIATTAVGTALAKMIETKDPSYARVVELAQSPVKVAAESFHLIGASASEIVKSYPINE